MFKGITLHTLQNAHGGQLSGADVEITKVSTDSRQLGKGDTFVALSGPNFNGNQFVSVAAASGATAAIVSEIDKDALIGQLQVEDALAALTRLAELNRQYFTGKTIAVTGSCGKTTVKELLAHVLGSPENVLCTEGNLNNHIGVPLTLCRLSAAHRYAVVELGASAVGEIAHTAGLARPDVAIITNAGAAHIEGFASYENIVKTKGEIIDAVGDNGCVILNKDDPAYEEWLARAGRRVVRSFSLEPGARADIEAQDITATDSGINFKLVCGAESYWVNLPLPGRHNVANALAVALAAQQTGLSLSDICQRLSTVKGAKGRSEMHMLSDGVVLIDDTYNANPVSMKAACDVLAQRLGVSVLVLGDMAELGENADTMHEEVGAYARLCGVDSLLCVGQYADAYVRGFGRGGNAFSDKKELIVWLSKLLNDRHENHIGTDNTLTILIKGSRSSSMETIIKQLQKQGDAHSC